MLLLLLVAASSVSLDACGGSTASIGGSPDGGGHDGGSESGPSDDGDAEAMDASPEDTGNGSGYLACMNGNGQLDAAVKGCSTDGDCIAEIEGLDCCGSMRYVGISTSQASAFAACDAAWEAHVHYNECDCRALPPVTEDGKPVSDPSAVEVHCTDFTNGSGVCMTYQP